MRCKKTGSITVFLTLMLSVLSAFVATLSSYAKSSVETAEASYAVDNAIRSCFAEYNRELFNRYHILLIDSSYKGQDNGERRVRDHFLTYLENGLTQNEACYADIKYCRNAAESCGEYVYDSAVRFAKEKIGIDPRLSGDGEEEYFLSYLINVLTDADDHCEGAQRMGEKEYILYGLESDAENINMALSEYSDAGETTYEDYLVRCMSETDISILRQRFCRVLTENMQKSGSPGFDLEKCYHHICVTAMLKGRQNGEYDITKEYAYVFSDIGKGEPYDRSGAHPSDIHDGATGACIRPPYVAYSP